MNTGKIQSLYSLPQNQEIGSLLQNMKSANHYKKITDSNGCRINLVKNRKFYINPPPHQTWGIGLVKKISHVFWP